MIATKNQRSLKRNAGNAYGIFHLNADTFIGSNHKFPWLQYQYYQIDKADLTLLPLTQTFLWCYRRSLCIFLRLLFRNGELEPRCLALRLHRFKRLR